MTPAERANLEYVYDTLYALYESGNIRPGEMQQLQDLDAILRPLQEAEAAMLRAQFLTTEETETNAYDGGDHSSRHAQRAREAAARRRDGLPPLGAKGGAPAPGQGQAPPDSQPAPPPDEEDGADDDTTNPLNQ
jgi:hypothetical protein